MGILARPLADGSGGRAPWDDYWYMPRQSGGSGVTAVSIESALTVPGFYAGVAYIAEDVGKVPLNMFEDLGEGGHRPAPNHPLQYKLHDQPNRHQGSLEFREMMTAFAMLRGKGIAEIRPGPRPLLDDEYVPLHPDLIREEMLGGGARRYMYRDPQRHFEERPLLDDQVLVIRGRLGASLIDVGRQALGLAQAQERHAGNLFSRGAKPGGVVLRDKPWIGDSARRNFRQALNEYAIDGAYTGRPLLLEDGMTWQDVGMKSSDAELLDSRRFSVVQFCQLIRIPPHKLFELERSTNNNIDRQSVDYVVDSLLGWTERWDQAIWRDLIIAKGRFFAEHNLDGLLKGDIETRYAAYALAVQWGWMTRNEVRAKENMNPLKGLSEPLTPLNMTKSPDGSVATTYGPSTALLEAGTSANEQLRGRLKLHASTAAARIVRRELATITKLAEKTAGHPDDFEAAVEAFYAEHGSQVASQLHVAEHQAIGYARAHRDQVITSGTAGLDAWLVDAASTLTELAMDQEALAA